MPLMVLLNMSFTFFDKQPDNTLRNPYKLTTRNSGEHRMRNIWNSTVGNSLRRTQRHRFGTALCTLVQRLALLVVAHLATSASGAIIDGHFSTEYDGQMPDGTHLWNTTVVNTTQSDSSDYSAWKIEFPVKIDDSMMPYSGDKTSWSVQSNKYENDALDPADNYFAIDTNLSYEYLLPDLARGPPEAKSITVTYRTSFGPDPSLEQTWKDFANYDAQIEMFTESAGSDQISGEEYTSGTDYGYLPSENAIPEPNSLVLFTLVGIAALQKRQVKNMDL